MMIGKQKSSASKAWHRYHVYHDPAFIKEVGSLPKRKLPDSYQDYHRIAEVFGIEASDVDFIHERTWSYDPKEQQDSSIVYINESGDRFIADLRIDITKEQLLRIYEYIELLRKENRITKKKYKSPADTELLYAIFKAKSHAKTFKEIFADYQKGALPYYKDKPSNQYASEDELEKYYRRYYGSKL